MNPTPRKHIRPSHSLLAAAVLCASLTAPARAEPPTAVLASEPSFAGNLLEGDLAGELTFETPDGRRTVAAHQLVRWGTCAEADRAPLLLLRDGSLLSAAILQVDDARMAVDADSLGLLRLPLAQLAAIVLRAPASVLDRDRLLDDVVRSPGDEARVRLLNGDDMNGELAAIDDRGISLRTSVGAVDLSFGQISTLTLAAPPGTGQSESGPPSIVGLADGSRIAAKGVVVGGQTAKLTTSGGLEWEIDRDQIVFLQPASPSILYLSDLQPSGYRHVPYLQQTWPYRRDRNVMGGLLRCQGQIHAKGLGMHTAARITYAPPDGVVELQATLGIDDETEGMGSARFRVFVDGNQQYVSPTVRGGDAPVPVSVPLAAAGRVDLVVDFADRADVQDHANWLDVRFVR